MQYDAGRSRLDPEEELDGILAHMPEIGVVMPGLADHLRLFPSSPLPGADDFLDWLKE